MDNETPLVSTQFLNDGLEGGWDGGLGLTRTGDLDQTLTVSYTVGGTATSGTDFTALSGSVTFQAGEFLVTVPVDALADSANDPGETVAITLQSGTGYTINTNAASASLTILESAPVVQIESGPSSLAEGTSGNIVLRRTGGNLSQELTVAVRVTGDGTTPAEWAYDYLVNGRLSMWSDWSQVTFAANQETLTLTAQTRLDDVSEGNEGFRVELGLGDGNAYLLHSSNTLGVVITNVVPTGTVPILAEEDKPLTANQANVLRAYLERVGKGEKLTALQATEMKDFLARLGKKGLEAEGEQRLQQLQSLLGAMSTAINRPGAVGGALDAYKDGVGGIISGVKLAKENSYQQFKLAMGGKVGAEGKKRYEDSVKDGFPTEWVGYFWIRYQAEVLQDKLNGM